MAQPEEHLPLVPRVSEEVLADALVAGRGCLSALRIIFVEELDEAMIIHLRANLLHHGVVAVSVPDVHTMELVGGTADICALRDLVASAGAIVPVVGEA